MAAALEAERARGALPLSSRSKLPFINTHHPMSLLYFLHMMHQPLHNQVAIVTGSWPDGPGVDGKCVPVKQQEGGEEHLHVHLATTDHSVTPAVPVKVKLYHGTTPH